MENLKLESYYGRYCIVQNDGEFLTVKFKFELIKSLSWKSNMFNVEIVIDDTASSFPFFSKNKIVVLFNNQPEFAQPNNLVIFNGDGTIFKRPLPSFIHQMSLKEMLEYHDRHKNKQEIQPVFRGIHNFMEIDGKGYLTVSITEKAVFELSHYFETRALDIDTGEWHPTWCSFTDPNANIGHGKDYEQK
jgi:hypothetical protein